MFLNANRDGPLEPSLSAGGGERGEIYSLSPFLRGEGRGEGQLLGEVRADRAPHPALCDSRTFASAFFLRTAAEGGLRSPRKNGARLEETHAAFASDDFVS